MFLISFLCPHHILYMLRPCPIWHDRRISVRFMSDIFRFPPVLPRFAQPLSQTTKPAAHFHLFDSNGNDWRELAWNHGLYWHPNWNYSWFILILLIDVNVWSPIKVESSISSSLNHITWRYINCNFRLFNASKRPQQSHTYKHFSTTVQNYITAVVACLVDADGQVQSGLWDGTETDRTSKTHRDFNLKQVETSLKCLTVGRDNRKISYVQNRNITLQS